MWMLMTLYTEFELIMDIGADMERIQKAGNAISFAMPEFDQLPESNRQSCHPPRPLPIQP
jgi:hypothetical protein